MRGVLCVLILALAAPGFAAEEPLGRLFFTPAQRVQLDAARKDRNRPVIPAEPESRAPLPERITVDGVVRRSDGKNTIWLNQRTVSDGKAAAGLPVTGRVRPDGSVHLTIPQTERFVDLKVGQSVEVGSGTIAEPYSRARTTTSPSAQAKGAEPGKSPAAATRSSTRRDADDDDPEQR